MLFLILFFLIYFVVILFLIVSDYKKKHFVGALSGVLAFFSILYGVVPVLLLLLQNEYSNRLSIYGFSNMYNTIYGSVNAESYVYLCINYFLGIIFLIFGHNLAHKKRSVDNDMVRQFDIREDNSIPRSIVKLAYFCFIFGAISLIIYVFSLGGITNAILKSELLRSFASTVETNSFLSLFKVPAALTPFSFYLFLIIPKNNNNCMVRRLMIVLSLFLSLLYLVVNAGKTPILLFVVFTLFAFLRKKNKHLWFKMFFVFFVCLVLMSSLDDLFALISYGPGHVQSYTVDESVLRVIRQFSYPFQIELHLNDISNIYGFLYFKNVVTDIIGIFPKLSFMQSYDVTSSFFGGIEWRATGSGVPIDLLSYGFLNFGFVGTCIYMFLVGLLLGVVDDSLIRYPANSYIRDTLAFLIACKFFSHVNSVDIQPIIQYETGLILLVVVIIFSSRKKLRKEYKMSSDRFCNYSS